MNNISIRLATISDRTQLATFFQHYKNQALINHRIDCYTSHNFTIVAKDGEKVIGIIQWYLKEDPKAGVVEFEEFCVIKDYQRQGIGTKIITFAIESVKKHFDKLGIKPRKIYLFVSLINLPAQALYEKLGFKGKIQVGHLFNDSDPELFYYLDLN